MLKHVVILNGRRFISFVVLQVQHQLHKTPAACRSLASWCEVDGIARTSEVSVSWSMCTWGGSELVTQFRSCWFQQRRGESAGAVRCAGAAAAAGGGRVSMPFVDSQQRSGIDAASALHNQRQWALGECVWCTSRPHCCTATPVAGWDSALA